MIEHNIRLCNSNKGTVFTDKSTKGQNCWANYLEGWLGLMEILPLRLGTMIQIGFSCNLPNLATIWVSCYNSQRIDES